MTRSLSNFLPLRSRMHTENQTCFNHRQLKAVKERVLSRRVKGKRFAGKLGSTLFKRIV